MNTTTRTALRLLIATPLAASALAIGGFAGAAHAETPGFDPNPGPVIVQPHDDEDPRPEGPGDIANPEDDDPRPEGPGDITNPEDEDEPGPQIPGDKDGPNPGDDDPQIPGDKDGPNPGDEPEDVPADEVPGEDVPADKNDKGGKSVKDAPAEQSDAVVVPTRIDAGAGPVEDEGSGLVWLLVGGGAVAAGSVLARKGATATR